MDGHNLPGKTGWETHQYLRDHGYRVAAAQAYRYLAQRIETDDTYPIPPGSETIIAHAAAAMQSLAAIREAVAEARAASKPSAA